MLVEGANEFSRAFRVDSFPEQRTVVPNICRLQTMDFDLNITFPFPLPKANREEANLSAIQANLTEIQANQSAT